MLEGVEKCRISRFQGGSAGSNPVGDTTFFWVLTRLNGPEHDHQAEPRTPSTEQLGPPLAFRLASGASPGSTQSRRPPPNPALQESVAVGSWIRRLGGLVWGSPPTVAVDAVAVG